MKLQLHSYIFCLTLLAGLPLGAQIAGTDFSAVDRWARQAPNTLEENLPALTAYLIEKASTDLEKTRAIYTWIITHIIYDEPAALRNKRTNHSIEDVLKRKRALCVGYAQLFREMCSLAGIPAYVINGYVRQSEFMRETFEEPNHSWNAARLDGRWYLFDPTWGYGTVGTDAPRYKPEADPYFAARPERLIRTHLPTNPMWQLLPNPLPTAAFMAADSSMKRHLPLADSTYAYGDSLQAFQKLSSNQQRLHEAAFTYLTHPTAANRTQYGHALIDYAGILADAVEAQQSQAAADELHRINDTIIRLCQKAQDLMTFYAWQRELYINVLINQAVLIYNRHSELDMPAEIATEQTLLLLKEALTVIEASDDSLFSQMARQQCEKYIAVIE